MYTFFEDHLKMCLLTCDSLSLPHYNRFQRVTDTHTFSRKYLYMYLVVSESVSTVISLTND